MRVTKEDRDRGWAGHVHDRFAIASGCSFCGSDATAYWRGGSYWRSGAFVGACGRCAETVLPALMADAADVFAPGPCRAARRAEVAFWKAMSLRLHRRGSNPE